MSRGRPRGGGGVGRGRAKKTGGPELTWELEPATESSANKPEPLFPPTAQSIPVALSGAEIERVNEYRHLRSLIHDGPLYTVLDRSQSTDRHGKVNKRAGFDPFEGMPSYSKRYEKPKRRLPDLSTRPYTLKFFPKELWPTLDQKRVNPAWNTLGPLLPDPPGTAIIAKGKGRADARVRQKDHGKRRRPETPSENEDDEDDEEDIVAVQPPSRKRAQRQGQDPVSKAVTGQRKGLEAEDDYGPDAEQADEDDPEGEEVAEDSAFEESDDGAGDDYNAENYFDAGDDDDFDEGRGGDDDGGTFLS